MCVLKKSELCIKTLIIHYDFTLLLQLHLLEQSKKKYWDHEYSEKCNPSHCVLIAL